MFMLGGLRLIFEIEFLLPILHQRWRLWTIPSSHNIKVYSTVPGFMVVNLYNYLAPVLFANACNLRLVYSG